MAPHAQTATRPARRQGLALSAEGPHRCGPLPETARQHAERLLGRPVKLRRAWLILRLLLLLLLLLQRRLLLLPATAAALAPRLGLRRALATWLE